MPLEHYSADPELLACCGAKLLPPGGAGDHADQGRKVTSAAAQPLPVVVIMPVVVDRSEPATLKAESKSESGAQTEEEPDTAEEPEPQETS